MAPIEYSGPLEKLIYEEKIQKLTISCQTPFKELCHNFLIRVFGINLCLHVSV
jgi:hypothetical protein